MTTVNKPMCKACRRKAYQRYDAWNEMAEHFANVGDSLQDCYITCPGPIVAEYLKKITRQVEDYVKEYIPEAFGVKLSYPEKKLYSIGEDVPVWCPYKDSGWKPEDDMTMVCINGEYVQDYAERGKTYEFD